MLPLNLAVKYMLNRTAKYLASFFKREWELDDYPVKTTRQGNPNSDPRVPSWVASIEGWNILGTGDSEADARADLLSHFENYRSKNALPRPGTRVPVSFEASAELDRHGEFAYEFVEAMVGVRPFFMSDESSLSDFEGVTPMSEVHAKILAAYGVDSTGFEAAPLWKLLDAVVAARVGG